MVDKNTKPNKFADTLNLPQTDFPMRAGLPKNEPKWLEKWEGEDHYQKIRAKSKGKEKFILHCGPPYANGNLHAGHVIPKTLKDIVVRAKTMAGFDAPYVPGWDCHGLPIEWKVETALREKGKDKNDLTIAELRQKCRDYANEWIATQKKQWQRLGCVGEWENPYLTMNPQNEADIVRELGKLVDKGYVYKGAKSVMWSPVEETALAEAEVEYQDHESTAVYVKFPVVGRENEYVVIWTTTPWTLPANRAVAYGADIDYVLVEVTQKHEKATVTVGEKLWFAEDLLNECTKMCGVEEYRILKPKNSDGSYTYDENYIPSEEPTDFSVEGEYFNGLKLKHPFYNNTEVPMLEGSHVTTEAGTGFVHIAPAHGLDDFYLGVANNLDISCPVDAKGHYEDNVPPLPTTDVAIAGMFYAKANKAIVAEMTENASLLRWHKVKHSYPHSWRSKKPLIFRTTPQWFVAMDNEGKLREKALEEIQKVRWVPSYGEKRITSMIAGRPDWCISRQRVWGVPITIFHNTKDGDFIRDPEVFEHVASLIEKEGIDAWDTRIDEGRVDELLPDGWLEANGLTLDDVEPERDILDVWFDSGTTHAHVVRRRPELNRGPGKRAADLYLEGSDQHRGWFQSSLLTSVAVYDEAPYDQVLTHGFAVDGEGKKMSKSIGNGMELMEMADKYGMDLARLWVASSDYSEDIRLSDEIMQYLGDAYRRFRNTFRYLLGNLSDFDEVQNKVNYDDLPELEKYMLHRLRDVLKQARKDYDNYQFHKVYQALYNLCNLDLSSFYFDIRKDVLYCDAKNGERRRAAQTVLMALLRGLTTCLAPIMPFTTDEVWRSRFGDDDSVHFHPFYGARDKWHNLALSDKWQELIAIREAVNAEIEKVREAKTVGSSLEAKVEVGLTEVEVEAFGGMSLADIFIVSAVDIVPYDGEGERPVRVTKAAGDKCPRCWVYKEDIGALSEEPEVCKRCGTALVANQKTRAA